MSREDEPSEPLRNELQSTALAATLRRYTTARVGLARSGVSLATRELLHFEQCRAQARDAVQSTLQPVSLAAAVAALTGHEAVCLHSAAPDRKTYLQRPDLGRILDEASHATLAALTPSHSPADATPTLAFLVADGLSALAVERHALPLIAALLPLTSAWRLAPICIVQQGRVAIGDQIAAALHAQASIVLIGERPGLSACDSLGAYITWDPRVGRTDSERNCVSNIRAEGLIYAQAAAQLGYYLTEARRRRLTGIALKEQAEEQAEDQSAAPGLPANSAAREIE